MPGPGGNSVPLPVDPDQLYRYIREINGQLLRAQARLEKQRKKLRQLEKDYAEKNRALRLALRAAQPQLAEDEPIDGVTTDQGELHV